MSLIQMLMLWKNCSKRWRYFRVQFLIFSILLMFIQSKEKGLTGNEWVTLEPLWTSIKICLVILLKMQIWFFWTCSNNWHYRNSGRTNQLYRRQQSSNQCSTTENIQNTHKYTGTSNIKSEGNFEKVSGVFC